MINCLVVDDEPLAREAIKVYIEKMPDLALVDECENALQAIDSLRQKQVDLIFLDIEMPEIDGISFLQMLKNIPGVIFTTAYRNYAVEAFELDVIDYLLKPISFNRFVSAINKYYERASTPANPTREVVKETARFLNVKADRKTYKVDISHIEYIESLKDYVKIVLTDQPRQAHGSREKTIVSHDSISHLEENLSDYGFIRIHRSFLVAIDKIKSFDAESVFLETNELPISRTYKKSVLAILENM